VWGALQELVYRKGTGFGTVAELRVSIQNAWENLSMSLIRKSINKFSPRLNAMIAAQGGHIEPFA
jgi:hypothetical protein